MTIEEIIRDQKQKMINDNRSYKIIRRPYLDEGYVYADSEEEAIENAIREWKIDRDTIIGAIHCSR